MLILYLIAIAATATNAHVRMVGSLSKVKETFLPIRNAPSIGANGRASVGGPCGGSKTFILKNAPEVLNGGKVKLAFQYAAGHENNANLFTVTMACNAPSENDLRLGDSKATTLTAAQCNTIQGGNTYPVPAKTGRDVKVVECTLPTKNSNDLVGVKGQCSLSFQDQRKWGGCVDFLYVNVLTGGGTTTPIPPNPPLVSLVSGSIKNIVTSGPAPKLPCCALNAVALVITASSKKGKDTTVTLTGTAAGTNCNAGIKFANNRIDLSSTEPMVLVGKEGELEFKSETNSKIVIGGIPASLSFGGGALSIVMLGDAR